MGTGSLRRIPIVAGDGSTRCRWRKVRARAVLSGSGRPEHQATGAVPQPTNTTQYGSCHFAEVRGKLDGSDNRRQKYISIHGLFQQPQAITLRTPRPEGWECNGDVTTVEVGRLRFRVNACRITAIRRVWIRPSGSLRPKHQTEEQRKSHQYSALPVEEELKNN